MRIRETLLLKSLAIVGSVLSLPTFSIMLPNASNLQVISTFLKSISLFLILAFSCVPSRFITELVAVVTCAKMVSFGSLGIGLDQLFWS